MSKCMTDINLRIQFMIVWVVWVVITGMSHSICHQQAENREDTGHKPGFPPENWSLQRSLPLWTSKTVPPDGAKHKTEEAFYILSTMGHFKTWTWRFMRPQCQGLWSWIDPSSDFSLCHSVQELLPAIFLDWISLGSFVSSATKKFYKWETNC